MISRRFQQNALVNDKARRAVSEFRKIQPTLTAFSRVLTGNPKVRVIAATGVPRTDGKDIFIQPPIELGEVRVHDRALCDQRDWTTLQQSCPACGVREEVMATTYHEISHIAFESFAAPDASRLKEALGYVRQVSTPKQAERIIRRITESAEIPKSYMALASVINPYFKLLANSLEDVRINARMHRARPGTKPMMDAQILRVMSDGITKPDGSVVRWTEMHLNHQASIGGYLVASGFEPQAGWLADEVLVALKDEQLRDLLILVPETEDAHQAFQASWQVFTRLRELGFYQLKEEEDDDEESGADDEKGDTPPPPTPPTPPQPQQQSEDPSESDDASDDEESAQGGSSDMEPDADEEDDSAEESEPAEENDGPESDAEPGEDESEGSGSEPSQDSDDDSEGHESGDDEAEGSSGGDDSDEEGQPGDADADESDEAGEDEDTQSDGGTASEPGDTDEVEEGSGSDSVEPSDTEAGDDGDDADGESAESGGDSEDAGDDASAPEPTESGEPEEADDEDGGGDGIGGGDSTGFRVEPDEAAEDEDIDLGDLGLHQHTEETDAQEEKAIEVAIVQGEYFEKPSTQINGVKEWRYETREDDAFSRSFHAWDGRQLSARDRRLLNGEVELPSEGVMGAALMRMRLVFAENKRTQRNRNQRSGRLETRALGKRAPFGDDRLFGKKVVPAKRDYIVSLYVDVSGSQAMGSGGVPNITLTKEAVLAQAELCARTGVPFEILAHTAAPASDAEKTGWAATNKNLWLDIYHIKDESEPWDDKAKQRLMDIGPSYYNLDGHTLEFARRRIEKHRATDKVILYYTDGKMPLENYDEELEILQREIATCKQQKITVLAVGIRTDSPLEHGLDTVQVDDSSDIGRVVQHLERRLVA